MKIVAKFDIDGCTFNILGDSNYYMIQRENCQILFHMYNGVYLLPNMRLVKDEKPYEESYLKAVEKFNKLKAIL